MKISSIKKFSILSLCLVSASAVIAAVLPSKNVDDLTGVVGSLEPSSGDDENLNTCVPTDNPTPGQTCNASNTDPDVSGNQGTTDTTISGPNGTSVDAVGGAENSTSTGIGAPSVNNTNLND